MMKFNTWTLDIPYRTLDIRPYAFIQHRASAFFFWNGPRKAENSFTGKPKVKHIGMVAKYI
jgi:hypothetical protein